MSDIKLSTSFFAVYFATALFITGCRGVSIVKLVVPEVVKNGTESSILLDCEYNLDKNDEGLVVKWFFAGAPNPVYQWIPNNKPQALGLLKGRINLDYRASEDQSHAHRAMQIINPTTELSGDYKCVVSTFADEAAATKKMVVYVSEHDMRLTTPLKPNEGVVTVRCSAEGVFPEPNMTISSKDRLDKPKVEVETSTRDGLYDIEATMTIDVKDLVNPTTFDCILRIPEANYTVRRSTAYYPDGTSDAISLTRPHLFFTVFSFLLFRL